MENKKKMNNKGFSLVELIVVVMIMAIIAVALAPQVMKWVENSRIANDVTTVNSVASAAQVATTQTEVLQEVAGAEGMTIKVSSSGVVVTCNKSGVTDKDSLEAQLKSYLATSDLTTIKTKSSIPSGSEPTISISSTGSVTVTLGSYLSSDDLGNK